MTKDSDKGPAMEVRMTQVAKRALDVIRLLPHLVCDRKVGRADAFPHAEDLPPVL